MSSSVAIDSRRFSPPDIPRTSSPPMRESRISKSASCFRTCVGAHSRFVGGIYACENDHIRDERARAMNI